MTDDWLESEEERDVQILQKKFVDDIELATCELEYSIEIGTCGFDGIGE